ncbi:MAG: 50S ribosomal protein L11 methyltransferase [Gammaproteobacteria bacterium]
MLELRLKISAENTECLEDLLLNLGALSLAREPQKDIPILEPEPGTIPLWDDLFLIALFEDNTDCLLLFKELYLAGLKENQIELKLLDPQTLLKAQNKWQEAFKGFGINNKLWIYPEWEASETNDHYPYKLLLNPGLAFGTGTHPTTALCLHWLSKQNLLNTLCLDYGSGSGILGLAALAMGAQFVYAIDYDPQAILSSQNNAQLNNFDSNQFIALSPEEFDLKKNGDCDADFIVANILAKPLIALGPIFKRLLAPNGLLAITGILENQVEELINSYCVLDLKLKTRTNSEGWSLLEFSHT